MKHNNKKSLSRARCVFRGGLIFLLSFIFVAVIGGTAYVLSAFDFVFPDAYLTAETVNIPTELYCRTDGKDGDDFELYATVEGAGLTIPVTESEIPETLKEAFVAIEDKRFYEHGGIDWYRTAGAVYSYLTRTGTFGGSTVTQQLVKNLTGDTDRTWKRKLQEAIYAVDLEKKLTKDEILTRYLNVINLSDGCIGVGAAAKHYFGKDVSELTLGECVTLAAITQNPSKYNPLRHPENNTARRAVILGEMERQGYIKGGETVSVSFSPQTKDPAEVRSWYTETVTEDVISDLQSVLGYSSGKAAALVYGGGLKIYTAMDADVQRILERYYENTERFSFGTDGSIPQSAAVIFDSQNGDLLAVVGAVGKKDANLIRNHATGTYRPPASALKPLSVYAPALQNGVITWASVYEDSPVSYLGASRTPWPKNASGVWAGNTDIATAIAESVNTVSVKVLRDIGKSTSVEFLHRVGLDGFSREDGEAALALGQTENGLALRALTEGYTVFSADGVYKPSRSYYLVTDRDGKVLLCNGEGSERILSRSNAAVMTKLLCEVTAWGTANSLTVKNATEVAGKTGTSSFCYDKWFIGYTPEYLCGVWCGYEYPAEHEGLDGHPAVDIFDGIMEKMLSAGKLHEHRFRLPADVIPVSYCTDSGGIPNAYCIAAGHDRVGYFVAGTEPACFCPLCKDTSDAHINPQGGILLEENDNGEGESEWETESSDAA